MAWLLSQSHLLRPDDVIAALAAVARSLGLSDPCVFLADMQQRHLMPLPDRQGQADQGQADQGQADQGQAGAEPLPIETTTAGLAYRTVTVRHVPATRASQDDQDDQDDQDGESGPHRIWVPLADGADLLGVLGLTAGDAGQDTLDRCRALASLAGLMVAGKARYSDTYVRAQRSRKMSLQAEMIWALLPPRAFATEHVLLSAFLEPAYEAGGDGFDYATHGDRLHVSLFDALGHNLSAGLLTSVCMASCRSSRRSDRSLAQMAARADAAIVRQFGDYRFVTALLADLEIGTGLLSWVCRGHPAPLLIRGNRTAAEFTRPPELPLGLSFVDEPAGGTSGEDPDIGATVHTEQLEPGDRVLFYTDGVTEGHTTGGAPFGVQRLGQFVIEHTAAGTAAPEMMRQLNHEIMDHQSGELRDDATVVMVEWEPGHPRRDLTAAESG